MNESGKEKGWIGQRGLKGVLYLHVSHLCNQIVLQVEFRVKLPPLEELHTSDEEGLVVGYRNKLENVKVKVAHLLQDEFQLCLLWGVEFQMREVRGGRHEGGCALSLLWLVSANELVQHEPAMNEAKSGKRSELRLESFIKCIYAKFSYKSSTYSVLRRPSRHFLGAVSILPHSHLPLSLARALVNLVLAAMMTWG